MIPAFHYDLSWGTLGNGPSQFETLSSIAIDTNDGSVWTGDDFISTVQKFDSNGNWILSIPNTVNHDVQWIVINQATGHLYTAANTQFQVQEYDSGGAGVKNYGAHGSGAGQFQSVVCCGVDSTGIVYGGDETLNRILQFNSAGTFLGVFNAAASFFTISNDDTVWVSQATGIFRYNAAGVLISSYLVAPGSPEPFFSNGSIFPVCFYTGDRAGIGCMDLQLNILGSYTNLGTAPGQLKNINSVAMASNLLYVADLDNHRVDRFSVSVSTGAPNIGPIAGRGATW